MRKDDYIPEELAAGATRIAEHFKSEVLELLRCGLTNQPPAPAPAPREWMTAAQLAEYWQLLNDKNEPTTAGILKWARRAPNQFPLPHAYMGDLLRFNRTEVDQWAREEAERRRTEKEKRRLKIA
jgi:predicted DNA-binding transcriptional regulator AlpA